MRVVIPKRGAKVLGSTLALAARSSKVCFRDAKYVCAYEGINNLWSQGYMLSSTKGNGSQIDDSCSCRTWMEYLQYRH